MNIARHARLDPLRGLRPAFVLAASLLLVFGCNKMRPTNMTPLDSVGMHSESIDQLKKYQVTDDEVRQILIAGKAGMSEQGCMKLVGIARARHRVFAEGDAIAELLGAGMKEDSVFQLVQLDQLTLFAGEAAAMRLAGISDDVILDVARHRAKGQVVIAGARLAELKDAGFSNTQLIGAVDRGVTDKEAGEIIAHHNYALGGHTFVHQQGRRR
jgi:hypothetical protein